MRSAKSLIWLVLTISILLARGASAVPVLQVYVDGGTPGTIGSDENTWFTTSNSFDLIVSGAYSPKTKSLTEITLLISVPEGETGTISISGDDDVALLAESTPAADGYFNPDADAVLDLLANEPGNAAGYDGYTTKDCLPGCVKFNNHYPLKDDTSDFILYDLGCFENISNAVSNYSTTGPIAYNVADGEEKTYSVLVSGFSSVHFDVYGYATYERCGQFKSRWSINPGSHDATYMVPEPATVALLGLGSAVFLRGRKRPLKRG